MHETSRIIAICQNDIELHGVVYDCSLELLSNGAVLLWCRSLVSELRQFGFEE